MVAMKRNGSLILPPTNKYAIKRERSVRQENVLLPGSKNPEYSLFPASLSHDRIKAKSMTTFFVAVYLLIPL